MSFRIEVLTVATFGHIENKTMGKKNPLNIARFHGDQSWHRDLIGKSDRTWK